jgi:hypothetical protein
MNPICYNSVTNHVYTQIKVSNAKPHTVQPKKENLIELFSVNQGRLSSRIRDFRLLHPYRTFHYHPHLHRLPRPLGMVQVVFVP